MTDGPLKSLTRAFDVIEILKDEQGLGVTELASILDIPPTTASDYLRTLENCGYASSVNGYYELSTKFLEMGGILKYKKRIFQSARAEISSLAEETGELAVLSIEEKGNSVLLHIVEGEEAHHFGVYPGMRLPLHTQASGKVILASYRSEELDSYIGEHGLEKRTENTITDRSMLESELEEIREQGYAVDHDEEVQGLGIVSTPIEVKEEDCLIGAVSSVAPTRKITKDEYQQMLVDHVLDAANIIAMNYRYGSRRS